MKKIIHSETLTICDIPILFIAKDQNNDRYLCMLIDEVGLKYLSIFISKKRLSEFTQGEIDLREVYQNPENSQYYTSCFPEKIESLVPFNGEITDNYLPEKNLFFKGWSQSL